MSKSKITVVKMSYAKNRIDEAFERITEFNQNPEKVKEYLLDWLHDFDFEVEVDDDQVNWNGYIIADGE